MADTLLDGLPRLVRIRDEVRMRGSAGLGIGAATLGWGILSWVLGNGVSVGTFALSAVVIGLPTLVLAAIVSGRRIRAAAQLGRPPRNGVYETFAAARERRTRVAGVVMFAVIVLMMFDHIRHGGGEMAGCVVGLFCAVGLIDVREARLWSAIERSREDARLYVIVPSHAVMARFGAQPVYERPAQDESFGDGVTRVAYDIDE